MLTREALKGCQVKENGQNMYMLFFEITTHQTGHSKTNTCQFNIVGLTEKEIKSLVPIEVISQRKITRLMKDRFDVTNIQGNKLTRDIFGFYFPATLYKAKDSDLYYFSFAFGQKYLEEKRLLKGLPSVSVVWNSGV
jgi:hypothetical protein